MPNPSWACARSRTIFFLWELLLPGQETINLIGNLHFFNREHSCSTLAARPRYLNRELSCPIGNLSFSSGTISNSWIEPFFYATRWECPCIAAGYDVCVSMESLYHVACLRKTKTICLSMTKNKNKTSCFRRKKEAFF